MQHIYSSLKFSLIAVAFVAMASCSEELATDTGWTPSEQQRSLSLSTSTLNYSAQAQSKDVDVKAENANWTFKNNAQWLSFSPASGSESATVTATVLSNEDDTVARTSFTHLESTDPSLPRSYDLTVTQSAPEVYINFSESSIIFDGDDSRKTVVVDCNRAWTFSCYVDWLTVERSGNSLIITSSVNDGNAAREGIINVSASDKNAQIKVTQRAANIISTIKKIEFPNSASERKFEIEADAPWEAECRQSWIDFAPKQGQAGKTTMTVKVLDNVNAEDLTGFIYITMGHKRLEIEVTQTGTLLQTSVDQLSFDSKAGSKTLSVSANVPWSLVTDATWIKLSQTSGKENAYITVNVEKNTGKARRGMIELQDKNGNVVKSVYVNQDGVSLNVYPTEADGGLVYGLKGGTKQLIIIGDIKWSLYSPYSWIKLGKTDGQGNDAVDVTVSENPSANPREGYITVYDDASVRLYKIPVVQSTSSIVVSPTDLTFDAMGDTKEVFIETEEEWSLAGPDWVSLSKASGTGNQTIKITAVKNDASIDRKARVNVLNVNGLVIKSVNINQPAVRLSVDNSVFNWGQEGGSGVVSVSSTVTWKATSSASWLTVSPPTGGDNVLVTLKAAENVSPSARTATVNFAASDGSVLESITVTQTAANISASPSSLAFGIDGGSKTLSISSNVGWTLSSSNSWITIGTKSGSKNASVQITVGANSATATREGSILLKNAHGDLIQTIAVSQAGGSISASPNTISVGPEGATEQISVFASAGVQWSLSSGASWVTLDKTTGSGNATVKATVKENTSTSSRDAVITLKDSKGNKVQEISVTQKSYSLVVTPMTITVNDAASSKTITINSNTNWTATSSESWVTVGTKSGQGNGSSKLSIAANTSTATRNATVTFKAGNITRNVSIKQSGKEVLTATPSSLSYPTSGSTQDLTITASGSWSLYTTSTWINIGTTAGNGNGTSKITVNANTDKSVRTGTVVLRNSRHENVQTIDVTQTALSMSASITQKSFDYSGGKTYLTVTSNTSWKLVAPSWITFSVKEGKSNTVVTVTVAAHSSLEGRVGTIELRDGSGNKVTTIQIEQSGMPEISDYTRDLNHTFPSKGGTLSVTSFEKTNWTAEVTKGSSWITLSPTSGPSSAALKVTTTENNSGNSRTGEIIITYGTKRYTCPVVQAGKTIQLSTSSVSFFAKGGQSSAISVTADKTVTISRNASWLSVTQSGNVFTVTADANTDQNARSAEITITMSGVSNAPSVTLTVRQAGVSGTFVFDGFENEENWD